MKAVSICAVVAVGVGVLIGAPVATSTSSQGKVVKLRITGGHVTEPRDRGRPVVLVAAALGVPATVFRSAFSHVTPAAAGEEPDPAQVLRNKAALLEALAPYGVTNEQLDSVSNHYRYKGSAGQLWTHETARAQAVVRNGKVVSVKLLSGGAGYSSTPRITVPGVPDALVKATVTYSTDLAANGAVVALK